MWGQSKSSVIGRKKGTLSAQSLEILNDVPEGQQITRKQLLQELKKRPGNENVKYGNVQNIVYPNSQLYNHPRLGYERKINDLTSVHHMRITRRRRSEALKILDGVPDGQTLTIEQLYSHLKQVAQYKDLGKFTLETVKEDVTSDRGLKQHPRLETAEDNKVIIPVDVQTAQIPQHDKKLEILARLPKRQILTPEQLHWRLQQEPNKSPELQFNPVFQLARRIGYHELGWKIRVRSYAEPRVEEIRYQLSLHLDLPPNIIEELSSYLRFYEVGAAIKEFGGVEWELGFKFQFYEFRAEFIDPRAREAAKKITEPTQKNFRFSFLAVYTVPPAPKIYRSFSTIPMRYRTEYMWIVRHRLKMLGFENVVLHDVLKFITLHSLGNGLFNLIYQLEPGNWAGDRYLYPRGQIITTLDQVAMVIGGIIPYQRAKIKETNLATYYSFNLLTPTSLDILEQMQQSQQFGINSIELQEDGSIQLVVNTAQKPDIELFRRLRRIILAEGDSKIQDLDIDVPEMISRLVEPARIDTVNQIAEEKPTEPSDAPVTSTVPSVLTSGTDKSVDLFDQTKDALRQVIMVLEGRGVYSTANYYNAKNGNSYYRFRPLPSSYEMLQGLEKRVRESGINRIAPFDNGDILLVIDQKKKSRLISILEEFIARQTQQINGGASIPKGRFELESTRKFREWAQKHEGETRPES